MIKLSIYIVLSLLILLNTNVLSKEKESIEYSIKKKEIHRIADKIWSSVGVVFTKPKLIINNKKIDPDDVETMIAFDPRKGAIILSTDFYDFCMEEGEEAFALVLAHEMGHYFNMHRSFSNVTGYIMTDKEKRLIAENYDIKELDEIKELETQADLFAVFHCYAAGYEINKHWSKILYKIYDLAKNPEDRYLSLKNRREIVKVVSNNMEKILPLLTVSKYIYLLDEFEFNAQIFNYIIDNNYSSWDMFYNSGASYFLAALNADNSSDSLFYPIVMLFDDRDNDNTQQASAERSLNQDHPGKKDFVNSMIAQSKLKFNYLVLMYPEYSLSYIMISLLYYYEGNLKYARNYAIKALDNAKNEFEINIAHTLLGIIFSKIDKNIALDEFEKARDFFIAQKNSQILNSNYKVIHNKREKQAISLESIDSVNSVNYFLYLKDLSPEIYEYNELDNLVIKHYNTFDFEAFEIKNKYGKLFVLKTNDNYDGSTSLGVHIGSKASDIEMKYGHPDKIMILNKIMFYKYYQRNIIFELKNNIVVSFYIYD